MDTPRNLYIVDRGNQAIRLIDTEGILTTLAGDGVIGSRGDGGPATAARFRSPTYIDVDDSGNVFVMDEGNRQVRKIFTNGVIKAVAGGGLNEHSGDGRRATEAGFVSAAGLAVDQHGYLFIADREANRVRIPDSLIHKVLSPLSFHRP